MSPSACRRPISSNYGDRLCPANLDEWYENDLCRHNRLAKKSRCCCALREPAVSKVPNFVESGIIVPMQESDRAFRNYSAGGWAEVKLRNEWMEHLGTLSTKWSAQSAICCA
ncbi:hypothetical protein KM043_016180 [Ampulex compressa]|nr:hypothetical protein KM043_016180 [Ampulex compressa]